jgi:hypothetical protein
MVQPARTMGGEQLDTGKRQQDDVRTANILAAKGE